MKSAAHQYEDRLLEFAYGELPQHEADAVDAHVRGCARCSQALSEIKSVRATMAALPMASAPDAGLESLLAYAEQAAERNRQKPAPSFWKRIMMPLASVMALVTVGVVAFRANEEFDTSPASAVADSRLQDLTRAKAEKKSDPSADLAVAPVVVAAAPPAAAEPEAEKEEARSRNDKQLERQEAKNLVALDDLREAGGKKGDVWAPEPRRAAPQSVSRRIETAKTPAVGNDEQVYRDDYSNAAGRGALAKETPVAPPPPVQAAAQDKVGYGLGSPSGNSNDGLLQGEAPKTKSPPVANKPSPAKDASQEKAQPQEEDSKKRAKTENDAPAPAPVAVAPPPMKLKGGYGIRPPLGSSSSMGAAEADESIALEKSDSLGLNREAKVAERQRAESRTQSLESARVASSRGDRLSEIRLAAQVLQNGASGSERVEALKRICDAYEFLGEPERADPFCDQLLQEFPSSVAARAIEDRRKRVQRAAPAPKNSADRKAMDEAPPRPAEAAPSSTSY